MTLVLFDPTEVLHSSICKSECLLSNFHFCERYLRTSFAKESLKKAC